MSLAQKLQVLAAVRERGGTARDVCTTLGWQTGRATQAMVRVYLEELLAEGKVTKRKKSQTDTFRWDAVEASYVPPQQPDAP